MCGNTIQPHIPPIRAFSRGKSVRNAYGKYGGFTTKKGNATVVLVLQLDFPFGSSVQVPHPTSYTASSGVFPRRIRTECVREVKRFHNEKGKGNCSTRMEMAAYDRMRVRRDGREPSSSASPRI